MRRGPRVVVWGGRPGFDVWVGSRADRRRQSLLTRREIIAFRMEVRATAFGHAVDRAQEAVRKVGGRRG